VRDDTLRLNQYNDKTIDTFINGTFGLSLRVLKKIKDITVYVHNELEKRY